MNKNARLYNKHMIEVSITEELKGRIGAHFAIKIIGVDSYSRYYKTNYALISFESSDQAKEIILFLQNVKLKCIDWRQVAIVNNVTSVHKHIDTFDVSKRDNRTWQFVWKCECVFCVVEKRHYLDIKITWYYKGEHFVNTKLFLRMDEAVSFIDELILKLEQLVKEIERKEYKEQQKVDSLFK